MNSLKICKALLAGAAFSVLAACASMQEPEVDTAATQLADAAPAKCRAGDAPTGSSIARRDCSSKTGVVSMDADELMGSRRFFVPPDSSLTRGK